MDLLAILVHSFSFSLFCFAFYINCSCNFCCGCYMLQKWYLFVCLFINSDLKCFPAHWTQEDFFLFLSIARFPFTVTTHTIDMSGKPAVLGCTVTAGMRHYKWWRLLKRLSCFKCARQEQNVELLVRRWWAFIAWCFLFPPPTLTAVAVEKVPILSFCTIYNK